MKLVLAIVAVGSWIGFWYQVGWGDSWRWGLAFLAVNLFVYAIMNETRRPL